MSRQTVAEYRTRGAPIGSRGPYDVEAIERWRKDNLTRPKEQTAQTATDEPSLPRRKLAAEVRIKEAQADQEETKRDKLRGALITLAEAKRELTRLATTVKQNVLAVPRANADRFVGLETIAEAEERLTVALSEALEALSKSEDT